VHIGKYLSKNLERYEEMVSYFSRLFLLLHIYIKKNLIVILLEYWIKPRSSVLL